MRKKHLVKTADAALWDDLGPELCRYLYDEPQRAYKRMQRVFTLGEQVVIATAPQLLTYGTVVYGPYAHGCYEVELEDGRILTIEDDGSNIARYVPEPPPAEEEF